MGAALLGAAAVAVAGALPVVALAIASSEATNEVRENTFAGAEATATAVANQAGQEYLAAVDTIARSRTGQTVLTALRADTAEPAQALLPRFMAAGPYTAVAMYDRAGVLIAHATDADGRVPVPDTASLATVSEGPVVSFGDQTIRRVTVTVDDPDSGARLGLLVADIDLSRLISNPAALRFGMTGVSKLVSTDGRVLLSGDTDTGSELIAPENRQIARDHRPVTLTLFTPFYGRDTVEAYVPVPDQPFGVLTQQSEAEALAGAHSLEDRLRQLQVVFAVFGVGLGAVVMIVVSRRDRRIVGKNEEVAAAQALFRSAFDNAPSGAALVSLDDRHLEVNRALCTLTGYRREELLERSVADITHPDDRANSTRLSEQVGAGVTDGYDAEKRYLRADGEVIWVRVRTSAVRDSAGRLSHTIRHVVDVTDRRRAASAMADAFARERRAAAQLRSLDAARTELLLTVSHDFRSPLTAAAGFASLLDAKWDGLDDAERRDMLARIIRNCTELERRVTGFLEYGRLEGASAELEMTLCDLSEVARAALDRSELMLQDRVVRDEIVPGTIVWADEAALGRVFDNLLSNSAKYSPHGSTVSLGATVNGDEVTVVVDDEGAGVPPDRAERIFDIFYRLSDGSTAAPGSGIGLAAVRQLVGLMRGRVWVEARASGGSSFRFTIPATSPGDESDSVVATQTMPDPQSN